MKRLLALLFVMILFGAGGYFFWQKSPSANQDASAESTDAQLTLKPQTATGSVVIESVTLRDNGYVVIRGVDGSRLGQIIEISEHLSPGQHKNITVSLGDFYEGGQELIALIYKDDGDQQFNGFDQPVFGRDGNMVARYVADGRAVPTASMQLVSSAHMGMAMETIRYTDTGFVPTTLQVKAGTMVEFVNESSDPMWVASNEHPAHSILSTFDQFNSTGKNGTYTYMFDKKGTWAYHDHINPAVEGVVVVQ